MMFFNRYLKGIGRSIKVFVSQEDEKRINQHHFKGKDVRQAGNFLLWSDLREMLFDPSVSHEIFSEVESEIRKGNVGLLSIEIDFDEVVGWSNTDDLEKYEGSVLEVFQPNKRSTGLRVKVGNTELLAPQTNFFTVVCRLNFQSGRSVLNIFTIYPGPDIGDVVNNISLRENIVFFDRAHPGA